MKRFLSTVLMLAASSFGFAQDADDPLSISTFSGLKFRSVGPALTSGRISDIAVHPEHRKIYYAATASGGLWKTVNSGTTWKPVFDSQPTYSIGCVTIDPNNPLVVWVGSGENNSQRSVAYGDGVYKSVDGGTTWKNMGLGESEHIANRRRSARLRHGLRRVSRSLVARRRRARSLQDDGRRRDLEPRPRD